MLKLCKIFIIKNVNRVWYNEFLIGTLNKSSGKYMFSITICFVIILYYLNSNRERIPTTFYIYVCIIIIMRLIYLHPRIADLQYNRHNRIQKDSFNSEYLYILMSFDNFSVLLCMKSLYFLYSSVFSFCACFFNFIVWNKIK